MWEGTSVDYLEPQKPTDESQCHRTEASFMDIQVQYAVWLYVCRRPTPRPEP